MDVVEEFDQRLTLKQLAAAGRGKKRGQKRATSLSPPPVKRSATSPLHISISPLASLGGHMSPTRASSNLSPLSKHAPPAKTPKVLAPKAGKKQTKGSNTKDNKTKKTASNKAKNSGSKILSTKILKNIKQKLKGPGKSSRKNNAKTDKSKTDIAVDSIKSAKVRQKKSESRKKNDKAKKCPKTGPQKGVKARGKEGAKVSKGQKRQRKQQQDSDDDDDILYSLVEDTPVSSEGKEETPDLEVTFRTIPASGRSFFIFYLLLSIIALNASR